MKRKRLFRRGLMLLMTLLLVGGCFWPALTADASDFSIDDSGFVNPTYDHQWLYIWRRGMPTASRESDVRYKRDILIIWDGIYYLKSTSAMIRKIKELYPTCVNGDTHDLNVGHLYMGTGVGAVGVGVGFGWYHYPSEITWNNGYFPYDGTNGWNKDLKYYYPNGYPHGWYMYTVPYANVAGLVSSLPFNYSMLDDADITATLQEIQDLPFGAYVGRLSNYNNEVGYGIGLRDVGTVWDYWVTADQEIHTWNDDHWYKADEQNTYVRATLDYWSTSRSVEYFPENGFAGARLREYYSWRLVPHEGTKKVSIETFGKGNVHRYNDDGFADNEDKDDLYHLYSYGTLFGCMAFAHTGNVFLTVGNANQYEYDYKYDDGHYNGRHPYLEDGQDLFDVYWCDRQRVNFLQTDISVANGQVVNLEGPMCNNATITVKEGGTLTITNWVANLGTIIVEPGATLYVQKDACLVRMRLPDNLENHEGGTIVSEGLIIVGENAKLCGGGKDGIHLKDGCHVVNYGLVTSENFVVDNPYTIENRDNGAVFYGSGNGVTGSGMGTWGNTTSSAGYKERGKVEPTCFTNLIPGSEGYVPNAIYKD